MTVVDEFFYLCVLELIYLYTFSVASKRNLGTTFSAGGLVYFHQYQQNFIDLYMELLTFSHFFLAV